MFKDSRGRGDYDIFPDISAGQINISTTYPGVIRAFHRHKYQDDNWYIVSGQFEVVLATVEDVNGDDVIHKFLGPGEKIKILPGVWHGFKVLGNEPGVLLYWVTNKFDPAKPDEERTIYNRFTDWKVQYK